jgi:hypothetical protein
MALAGLNPVLADVPAVMDRVPGNAAIIITIRDMQQFSSRFEDLAKAIKAPMDENDDENPIAMTKKLLAVDGLNKHGSLAVTMMPGQDGKVDFEQEGGPVVIVVPVSDYATFAKALGATDTTGISEVKIKDEPAFAKDLGGGFAALSPHKELVEAFEGKAGHMDKHKSDLGKNGNQIADGSDLMVVFSVEALKPQMEEGVAQMKEQFNNMGAMAGPEAEQAQAAFDMITTLADSFVRDAQVAVVGLGLGDAGVSMDFGAQYKEGSPSAKVLSSEGAPGKFLARVPNQPFLFAMAMDLTAPGIKQLVKDMGSMSEKSGKDSPFTGMGGMGVLSKTIDKVDGNAAVLGASPAGIMGLFANMVTYTSTSDPEGYMKAARETLTSMDGKDLQGIKAKVEYSPASVDVAGLKADTWSFQLQPDANNPAAGQIQMVMGVMFGQGGLTGMTAAVDHGVVSTLSQNSPLFTKAVEAAKNGKGLSEDEQIKAVQEHLPAGRTFEMYLGTKSILDAVGAAMGMFGGGVELKVPDKVSPVGMGASTQGGGMDFRVYVPHDVIKTIADIGESMKKPPAEEEAPANNNGEKPKTPKF